MLNTSCHVKTSECSGYCVVVLKTLVTYFILLTVAVVVCLCLYIFTVLFVLHNVKEKNVLS